MPAPTSILYFDLGSPYAYLAVERAVSVFDVPPRLQPVLLGALFAERGWGSWSATAERAANIAEVQRRARTYGLPDIEWPDGWPTNTLTAMRASIWADRRGVGEAFARAAFRAAFVRGLDLANQDTLLETGESVGLVATEMQLALSDPEVKDALRTATGEALAAGVRGVPTVRVGERVYYGDERLEEAAAAA
jgi:2-hydroxychromene-2-carboxylate isomerase